MKRIARFIHMCLDTMIQIAFKLFTRNSLYSGYLTTASYTPWKKDKLFINLYKTIKAHTLVDQYKAYGLWMLVQQSSKLDGALLEVGVWRGGTGALIAKRAEICGIHDKIYLCDTFTGVIKATKNDPHYMGGEWADTSEEIVKKLLKRVDAENAIVLKGIFPDETGTMIEDKQIRFCHIDVDTYESAKDILNWVWPRMPRGGILVYDDYGSIDCQGIRKHVEEQLDISDRVVIHNLNGQGIIIKIA